MCSLSTAQKWPLKRDRWEFNFLPLEWRKGVLFYYTHTKGQVFLIFPKAEFPFHFGIASLYFFFGNFSPHPCHWRWRWWDFCFYWLNSSHTRGTLMGKLDEFGFPVICNLRTRMGGVQSWVTKLMLSKNWAWVLVAEPLKAPWHLCFPKTEISYIPLNIFIKRCIVLEGNCGSKIHFLVFNWYKGDENQSPLKLYPSKPIFIQPFVQQIQLSFFFFFDYQWSFFSTFKVCKSLCLLKAMCAFKEMFSVFSDMLSNA